MIKLPPQHPDWAEDAMLDRSKPPYGIINTFSNIVYPAIGAYAWVVDGAWLFGLCMIWLGIGSGAYHCWKSHWGEAMDDSGMWTVFGLFLAGVQGVIFGFIFGFVNWLPKFQRRTISHRAIIKICAAILLLQIGLVAWKAALWFAAGYIFWEGGKRRIDFDGNVDEFTPRWYSRWCHGAWHLLTAVGFYVLLGVVS